MILSDVSIKNPVFAWMIMIALILFGALSVSRMGISQMPDVDFPIVTIDCTYSGASPEIVETDVTDIIEDAVMSVEGIREVRSVSQQDTSTVTVELDIKYDVDIALQEIQAKIAQAQRLLPAEMDPPVIRKRNPEDIPIVWVALTSEGPIRDLMVYARYHVRDKLQTVPNVAAANLGGYIDRNVRIWIDRNKLAGYELSVEDVLNAIGRDHVEVPGGILQSDSSAFVLRSMGEMTTVKQIEDIPITARGGAPIFSRILIRDVATVVDGLNDTHAIARFNGKPTVGFGIMKQRKTDAVEVAHAVKKKIVEIEKDLPPGYHIAVSNDLSTFVEDSTNDLVFTLVLSVILTSLVCFAFLGSVSSTVNILLAIPTSIMGTFIPLYFLGYTLNTFTLLGLSLVVGIVVDDAIMVLENISRHQELGENKVMAARNGAAQIAFAALAATLAVIAIFLPVTFMDGIIGRYFLQFGVTISVAVLLSLFEALTLTPMRCSQFVEVGGESSSILYRVVNGAFQKLALFYKKLLVKALNNRVKVIAVALAFFGLTMFIMGPIKKELMPPQDQSMFMIRIKLAPGTPIDKTDEYVKKVEAILSSRGEVLRYFTRIGDGSSSGSDNTAQIMVSLKDIKKRPVDRAAKKRLGQVEFANYIRKESNKIPWNEKALVTIQDFSMRGLSSSRGYPVEFIIRGSDWDKLGELAITICDKMRASGKMTDVDTSFDTGQPELRLIPNRQMAESRGVSMAAIGTTISALVGGQKCGKFTDEGHRFDIRVRLKEGERNRLGDLSKISVRNNRGELVNLLDVVTVKQASSMLSITHVNRERAINIYASPAPGFTQQQAIESAMKLVKESFPSGYTAELSGTSKTSTESFSSLIFALLVGILISYMILASQFNSYIDPLTILLALPFSFSGAIIALFIMGKSLNLFSFIGIILLMGLVKKNSILLVEFTNQIRDQGENVHDALLRACPIRLRPIVMTSFATIAAALPPALALGPGAETRVPMAIAVLGGIILSTILTLVVVPCVYSLTARPRKKIFFDNEAAGSAAVETSLAAAEEPVRAAKTKQKR